MEPTELAAAYVAAWNETDDDRREAALGRLYAPEGRIVTATSDCNGIDEVVDHVSEVVAKFIRGSGYRFRGAAVSAHHACVLLRWEMVDPSVEGILDWGLNTLVLNADGRIEGDYQFVAPGWPAPPS